MTSFQNLLMWQRAHQTTLEIYRTTASFPKSEIYGLSSQLRRSSASIASNIAEGSSFQSHRQFYRFLEMVKGSAAEVDYQLILAHELGYLDPKDADRLRKLVGECRAMIFGFMKRLKTPKSTGTSEPQAAAAVATNSDR